MAADPVRWYPDFASDYEAGSCTTTPHPALLAFSPDPPSSLDASPLARSDAESCCAAWFPEQEGRRCLRGRAAVEIDAAAAPVAAAPPPLAKEPEYWYPRFDITYEEGRCVKAGVNTDDVAPHYYTEEGGFLHATMDACCAEWFGQQEGARCLAVMDELALVTQPAASMAATNVTRTSDAIVGPWDSAVYFDAPAATLNYY